MNVQLTNNSEADKAYRLASGILANVGTEVASDAHCLHCAVQEAHSSLAA